MPVTSLSLPHAAAVGSAVALLGAVVTARTLLRPLAVGRLPA